jgi:DNA polymerase I-like protein with 3'-5' exonuclease and polymerase domains
LENGHSLESWGERLKKPKTDYKTSWEEAVGRKVGYKGEEFDNPVMDVMVKYCITDTEVCCFLYQHLLSLLGKLKYSDKSIELEHQVAVIIKQQEDNGWFVDVKQATMLYAELTGRQQQIRDKLQQIFPPITHERISEKTGKRLADRIEEFNPGSRKQIADRLISVGWKPTEKTEGGDWKVDETVLEGVDIPEAKEVAHYLTLGKRTSQLKSWLDVIQDDGRIHGKVITNGAITGRATHSSPNMSQVAGVNVPYGAEMRKCFSSPEGMVIVGCDLSGIELRCLAHYINNPDFTNELLNGDIHERNRVACKLETRAEAKTAVYATIYGAGDAKLGNGSARRGLAIRRGLMASMTGYQELDAKVKKIAAKGSLPGLDGRRVWVRNEHAALNTLLQSAGAIIAKQWLVELHKSLECATIEALQINWSHDEVELECRPEDAERVGIIAVEAAAKAGAVLGLRCPVGAEYKIGKNWYDVH